MLRSRWSGADAVLAFVPDGNELQCTYASGSRAQFFAALRLRRDCDRSLPAIAARLGHRVELESSSSPLIPTDAAALAAPMNDAGSPLAVVYVSSANSALRRAGDLVEAIEHAAVPYALALEREAHERRALYDGLTGLLTPRAFRERLQSEIEDARAKAAVPLGLWFVDTDRFKEINDALGHAAGDRILQIVARSLSAALVDGEAAARNGGDEFCALLRGTPKIASIQRAQRFRDVMRAADCGIGKAVTVSVGVAGYPDDALDAASLLEAADAAMYHSKRSGRDCVAFAADRAFATFT